MTMAKFRKDLEVSRDMEIDKDDEYMNALSKDVISKWSVRYMVDKVVRKRELSNIKDVLEEARCVGKLVYYKKRKKLEGFVQFHVPPKRVYKFLGKEVSAEPCLDNLEIKVF